MHAPAGGAPLSLSQAWVWRTCKRGVPKELAYPAVSAFRLMGRLDREAFRAALDQIIERHDVLRTTIAATETGPFQVNASQSAGFPVLERGIEDSSEIFSVIRRRVNEPVDLSRGPLVSGDLLAVSKEEHVFLISHHPVILDDPSIGVMMRELGTLYGALLQNKSPLLPKSQLQYADYVYRQLGSKSEELRDGQRAFWSQYLSDAPAALSIPTDRGRIPGQHHAGELADLDLGSRLSRQIRELAADEDVRPLAVLLASLAILLGRWGRQRDVLLGMVLPDRAHEGFESMLGMLETEFAVRVKLGPELTVAGLLKQVDETLTEARRNANGFAAAYEDKPPLQVMLKFDDGGAIESAKAKFRESGILLTMLTGGAGDTVTPELSFSLTSAGENLVGTVEYAKNLYDRDTVDRLIASWTLLLYGMASERLQAIGRIPLMTDAESRQVLIEFNNAARVCPSDRAVHELFEEQVARSPDAIAIRCENHVLTYRELNKKANQLAHRLRRNGETRGKLVPVILPRCEQMLIAQIALLKCGCAYVPLDPALPPDRKLFIICDCEATLVIHGSGVSVESERGLISLQWFDLDGMADDIGQCPLDNLNLPVDMEVPLYVMYTSGSTGMPKGVIIPHRGVVRLAINNGYADIVSTDCVAHCSNPAFDASTFETWGALLNGASVLVVPSSVVLDAWYFENELRRHGVTVLWMTSGLFVRYVEALAAVFSQLRYLIIGGDVVDPMSISKLLHQNPPKNFLNAYGPTECTTFSTTYRITSIEGREARVPIGRPIANSQVYILDEYRQPVPIGAMGEIYIGGAGVALGYLKRAELTEAHFIPDPFAAERNRFLYRSGDLGRWRPDGNVDFLGRDDQQIKLRGFRIELGEIEACLRLHPAVMETVVSALEDELGEKRLVAYVLADMPKLKSVGHEQHGESSAELVDQWQGLYEDTYSRAPEEPSFVGWNSSYTRAPIPEAQMDEWLNNTVESIRSLKPNRVLEIGCGTGLLLEQLAPECERYDGMDFSRKAIDKLQRFVASRDDLKHVRLRHSSALDMQESMLGNYDTVILNSVIQYFPDIEYLQSVLHQAAKYVAKQGTIFVGDVRHFGLLRTFHSSVQLERAASNATASKLRRRVLRGVSSEKELLVDPRFFKSLLSEISTIGSVEIMLKRGRSASEMTRYRYDVALRVGARPKPVETQQYFGDGGEPVTELIARIHRERPVAAAVLGIPNVRLQKDLAAERLIETSEEKVTTGTMKESLSHMKIEGEDPDKFWSLALDDRYRVSVGWTDGRNDGRFDVHLVDRTRIGASAVAGEVVSRAPGVASGEPSAKTDYANDPWGKSLQRKLIPELRRYLEARLPNYMVVSSIVLMEKFPLTPNGKLHRSALPVPEQFSSESDIGEAPSGEVEEKLAAIWEELLHVDEIGRDSDFFELGGHSLTGLKLIASLPSLFGVPSVVGSIFQYPTIRKMAELIEKRPSSYPQSLGTDQWPGQTGTL